MKEREKMKKALIIATIGGFICSFEKNDIKLLKNLEYEVYIACNTKGREEELEQLGCKIVHLPIERNPFKKQNVTSYHQLKALIEKEQFELIHCHTPVGGVLARMAGRKQRKTGTKIIYTAHGFHFFKGAPIVNWLIYYPVERWLSRYTDVLITINQEDYQRAKMFHAKKVEYIPGVGVDTEKFSSERFSKELRLKMREELSIKDNTVVLFSVGELSERKNHKVIIEAIGRIKSEDIKYLIAGTGPLEAEYNKLIKKFGIEDKVQLLGFRRDIKELCFMSDIFVHPSKREGLGIAALEGMAMGLPLISSNINGIMDYAIEGKTGFCCGVNDIEGYKEAICTLAHDLELRKKYGRFNLEQVKKFDIQNTQNIMKRIYCEL